MQQKTMPITIHVPKDWKIVLYSETPVVDGDRVDSIEYKVVAERPAERESSPCP